jgi:hypothetical protein
LNVFDSFRVRAPRHVQKTVEARAHGKALLDLHVENAFLQRRVGVQDGHNFCVHRAETLVGQLDGTLCQWLSLQMLQLGPQFRQQLQRLLQRQQLVDTLLGDLGCAIKLGILHVHCCE